MALVAEGASALKEQIAGTAASLRDGRTQAIAAASHSLHLSPALWPGAQSRPALGLDAGLAFVYPGLGNLPRGRGSTLSAHWPEILRRQDRENERLRARLTAG